MNNDSKGYISLFEVFKALTNTKVAPEDKDLVKRLTERSMTTTQTGLSGYRVDAPIDDWDEVEKELDRAKIIIENELSLSEKDRVFRDCLLVLMRSIDVKTRKVDELIAKLEGIK